MDNKNFITGLFSILIATSHCFGQTTTLPPAKLSYLKKLFFCVLLVSCFSVSFAQVGKYFNSTGTKCKNSKVFIDQRIQQYAGSAITLEWTGICKDGFASGNGLLTVISKVVNRSFTMTYNGTLNKGKKAGTGSLNLFLFYPSFSPYYTYTGSFKNDEFDGYGEFKADYPYPVDPGDIGKGISMESLALDLAIWRSDLFFYEYKGNFINGKIADTENGVGKTKKLKNIANAVRYTGAIKNSRPNGKGTATEETIQIYPNYRAYISMSGNFVNGRLNGNGKEKGGYFEYEGEYVNGIREGKGKMTHFDINFNNLTLQPTSIIEGNFTNGVANGFCTVYFQNSAAFKYTGPMKNGGLDGTGEIEYLDGSKFRGNFKAGKIEGTGAVIFADGNRFSGEYINDKPYRGKMYYANGSIYEGGFSIREEKDKITGKPVNVYIRQGSGTLTDKDGQKTNVNCDNDNCTTGN